MKIDEQEYRQMLTPDEVERLLTPDEASAGEDVAGAQQDAARDDEGVIDFSDGDDAAEDAASAVPSAPDTRTARQKAIDAIDDDDDEAIPWNLRNIVAAEVLNSRWLRRQWKFAAFLILLCIIHISDRYATQQQVGEIEKLTEQKKDLTIRLTLRSTEVLERSRQATVLQALSQTKDSTLRLPEVKPFVLEQSK